MIEAGTDRDRLEFAELSPTMQSARGVLSERVARAEYTERPPGSVISLPPVRRHSFSLPSLVLRELECQSVPIHKSHLLTFGRRQY